MLNKGSSSKIDYLLHHSTPQLPSAITDEESKAQKQYRTNNNWLASPPVNYWKAKWPGDRNYKEGS